VQVLADKFHETDLLAFSEKLMQLSSV